jgi:hypothetical protein
MPSPVEEWARSLPLAQIVAEALPKNDCLIKEQLRYLSKTSQDQLAESCDAITEGVRRSLQEQLAVLKRAYEKLDSQAAAVSNDKFQIVSMSVGDISDFHEGLAARIGNHSLHHQVILYLCYSDTAWSGPQVNPIWISKRPWKQSTAAWEATKMETTASKLALLTSGPSRPVATTTDLRHGRSMS